MYEQVHCKDLQIAKQENFVQVIQKERQMHKHQESEQMSKLVNKHVWVGTQEREKERERGGKAETETERETEAMK